VRATFPVRKFATQPADQPGFQQEGANVMARWNVEAMGQVGLTGWTREIGRPIASSLARKTGRSEDQILSLIGAGFLAMTLIDFLRTVIAVIEAGRSGREGTTEEAT
jgi:hypothetical protein